MYIYAYIHKQIIEEFINELTFHFYVNTQICSVKGAPEGSNSKLENRKNNYYCYCCNFGGRFYVHIYLFMYVLLFILFFNVLKTKVSGEGEVVYPWFWCS